MWASASRGARGWELKQLADRLAEMPCLVAKDVAEGWIFVIPQWPAMAGVRKYRPLPEATRNGSNRPLADLQA